MHIHSNVAKKPIAKLVNTKPRLQKEKETFIILDITLKF